MLNALTIDVEDWRQLMYRRMTGNTVSPYLAVVDETRFILDVLSTYNIRATFFVLSNVAKAFPELIRQIKDAGHEIASHGLSHTLVYRQTPVQFRKETRMAKELLESIIDEPVHGYRAAEFSITKQSWWALDILAEEGFAYDSSIYPVAGTRYGVPNFPLEPHLIRTSHDNSILEFPLTAIEWWRRRWPVAGGGRFRLLPYWLTRAAIRAVNRQRRPAVVYFHPYEFAQNKLHVPLPKLSLRAGLTFITYSTFHNFAREQVRHRFIKLLSDFKFAPIGELVQHVRVNEKVL